MANKPLDKRKEYGLVKPAVQGDSVLSVLLFFCICVAAKRLTAKPVPFDRCRQLTECALLHIYKYTNIHICMHTYIMSVCVGFHCKFYALY